MKALIFNSGIGHRLGKLTENNPKCMLKLYNGESIFERQIRLLSSCGIKEIIVTTGPFADQLYEVAKHFPEVKFEFVSNPDYKNTNYIVSMDEANEFLDDDILMLHGDLVFNRNLLIKLINDSHDSACLFNETMALPEKDFKGRIVDGLLKEVSIDIFDDNCFTYNLNAYYQ